MHVPLIHELTVRQIFQPAKNYAYHSLNSGRWCPLTTKVRSPILTPIDMINRKSVATPWFSVKPLQVFPLNGDLILNGRPRAHHEDPIQALHSPMLQYGISATVNLELLVTSHNNKVYPTWRYYISDLDLHGVQIVIYYSTITPLLYWLIRLDPLHHFNYIRTFWHNLIEFLGNSMSMLLLKCESMLK